MLTWKLASSFTSPPHAGGRESKLFPQSMAVSHLACSVTSLALSYLCPLKPMSVESFPSWSGSHRPAISPFPFLPTAVHVSTLSSQPDSPDTRLLPSASPCPPANSDTKLVFHGVLHFYFRSVIFLYFFFKKPTISQIYLFMELYTFCLTILYGNSFCMYTLL